MKFNYHDLNKFGIYENDSRPSLVPAFIPSMQISSIHLFANPLLWSFDSVA